jgi:hypothetical protein
VAEGWRAPALNAHNPAARTWTADTLYTYLRTGLSPDHSAAAGPMGPVVEGLAQAPEQDVRAIATYIASLMAGRPVPPPPGGRRAMMRQRRPGCSPKAPRSLPEPARAAMAGRAHARPGPPSLSFATALRDHDPTSAAQAILQGSNRPSPTGGPKCRPSPPA